MNLSRMHAGCAALLLVVAACGGRHPSVVVSLERHTFSAHGHVTVLGLGSGAEADAAEHLVLVTEWSADVELIAEGIAQQWPAPEPGVYRRTEHFVGRLVRGEDRTLFRDSVSFAVYLDSDRLDVDGEAFSRRRGNVFVVQRGAERRVMQTTPERLAPLLDAGHREALRRLDLLPLLESQ